MSVVTLKAHFDGKHILLDEPFSLPEGSPLIVTLLYPGEDGERAEWAQISAKGLARAYAEDEPEYLASDVKP